LTPQASALAATTTTPSSTAGASTATHEVAVPLAYQRESTPAELLAAARQAASSQAASSQATKQQPAWYTVRSGDSLSAIAGRVYRDPAAWPVLYWGNKDKVRWADDIKVGQVLRVPAKPARIPGPPTQLEPLVVHTSYAPRHAASAAPAAPAAPVHAVTDSFYSGAYPGGAFGECVVARESGGNPQVMNASGHYGLYQFSEATWVAYGGNAADFGHASVAEQNQVFANALARGGEGNWAPYDGC
jgi:LysM repeat protein